MSLRSFLLRLVLSLLLVFAQQQGIRHELSHDFDALAHKQVPGAPLHDVCAQCLSFANLGHAPPPALPVLRVNESAHALPGSAVVTVRVAERPAHYRSRAPPTHS